MSVDAKFIRDIDPYFQYPTDENPTTQQEYQEAVRNWVSTEEAIVDSHLWQPTTNYNVGNQVKTPSLPPQCVLVCTAAGTSGNEEPDYTNVDVGDSVTDGTVTWLISEAITSAGGTMTGNIILSDGGNPLSTAGGTMSGAIGFETFAGKILDFGGTGHGNLVLQEENDHQVIYFSANTNGGYPPEGAQLILHSADGNGGYGNAIIRVGNDGSTCKDLRMYPNGSLTWGGVSLTDGTFLTVRHVNVTTRSGTLNYNISAPAVSGYQFLCWVMSATYGYVNYSYIAAAWNPNTSFWMGSPNSGSVDCTAVYVRKW